MLRALDLRMELEPYRRPLAGRWNQVRSYFPIGIPLASSPGTEYTDDKGIPEHPYEGISHADCSMAQDGRPFAIPASSD